MLEIKVEGEGRVALSGRFDASQVDKAREALGAIRDSIVADLTDLEYISSAGLGVLMATYKRLLDSGETMRLVNLNDRIRNVFRLAGLDQVLPVD